MERVSDTAQNQYVGENSLSQSRPFPPFKTTNLVTKKGWILDIVQDKKGKKRCGRKFYTCIQVSTRMRGYQRCRSTAGLLARSYRIKKYCIVVEGGARDRFKKSILTTKREGEAGNNL